MRTTQAIVIPEAGRVELREVALTPPGPDDVVVRTAWTSISAGTERMLLGGRMPHPMLSFPVVPGYETVGRVVSTGANVPHALRDRWVFVGGARCFVDHNPAWGGQAAELVVDHQRVVPLERIEPRQGVLLALGATALHGVDLLALQAGQRALVLGQGPVGQLAARILRGQGRWVAVADRDTARLALSDADMRINVTGVPEIIGSDNEPYSELQMSGHKLDAIVEASGSMAALAEALPLLADGGTILLLGYYDELRLPYMPLFLKQVRLLTAREWAPGDPQRFLGLLADGSLDVAPLLTHSLPADEAATAYEIALHDPECLKLVLSWSDE